MAINFSNGGILIQHPSELPDVAFRNLFMDFETSSGHPQINSLNPWDKAHCKIIGAAITGDHYKHVLFVPLNILLQKPQWLFGLLNNANCWINHHVKYDNHVLYNAAYPEGSIACKYEGETIDTIVLAKIIDIDRTYKGGYGLDVLSKHWLNEDISSYYKALYPYLYSKGGKQVNQDYGRIPIDILAEYSCAQVQANRKLYFFELDYIPEECTELARTEVKVTTVLTNIERRGLLIDPVEVAEKSLICKMRMQLIGERLKNLLGYEINPKSSDQVCDVLINRFGLPVVSWTNPEALESETNNPSFDKQAMELYTNLPEARPYREIIELIKEYRTTYTHDSIYYEPWQHKHINNVLHPEYNQCVRSGRMSCKEPNAQNLDKIAKECIKPRPGYSLLSKDNSQVEYRLIVDYTGDERGIAAFNANPWTDYHDWVAALCAIHRKPAKTVNFMLGFGGGKKKTTDMLAGLPEVAAESTDRRVIQQRAEQIFYAYHRNLPNLKRTSSEAGIVAKRRGFVFNKHKRRLHLPATRAHIAFNRIIQSEAADIMKDQAVDLYEYSLDKDCYLNALVHDEALSEVPIGCEQDFCNDMVPLMERTRHKYSVPIKVSCCYSKENWRKCDTKDYPESRLWPSTEQHRPAEETMPAPEMVYAEA
jgi:DNA polymerase I